MRVSNSSQVLTLSYMSSSKASSSTDVYTGDHEVSYSGRSDIVKSKADASGWRKPTPYAAIFRQSVPYKGTLSFIDEYDAWGGGTDFIRRTFIGSLSLLPPYLDLYKPPPLVIPTLDGAKVFQRAKNKALENLKDQQIQYATFLAESGRSAKMLVSNASRVAKALSLVKKGRFKDAANELRISSKSFKSKTRPKTDREVSARWLEAQYGWLPLLSDMYDIYGDIQKGFFREPRISAKAKVTDARAYTNKISAQIYKGTETVETIESCFIRLDYVLSSAKLQTAVSKGLTNPLEVAWELVPYSFIADWFAPIGDFISALDADFGVTFKAGTYTSYSRVVVKGDLSPQKWQSNETHRYTTTGEISSLFSETRIDRFLFPSSPSGSLYFKNPLSLAHVANALALIHQRFR